MVPSTSVPVKFTVTGTSSGLFTLLETATGASFTSLTVITALAAADTAPLLSVTTNGIVTVPLKFGAGLKIKPAACAGVSGVFASTGVVPSAKYSTPCKTLGNVGTVTLTTVPSTSVPAKLTAIGVSSPPVAVVAVAWGGSFTGVTVNVSVLVLVSTGAPLSATV